jgi:8-oxo-dGTP pyrophosphatase MutT (NUDIX family)
MPGGHIDEEDRSIEAGAVRELEEEANLRCEISDLTYLGEPKPQKYVFLTEKWTGEVDVDKPNPESGQIEHDDWKWATIEDIKDIANTEIPIYLLEKALEISKNEDNS